MRSQRIGTLGATAGLSSSAGSTVGQANRGTRHFKSVGALAVIHAALAYCAVAIEAAPATRPNVIVVITDDQGYGDFSCHGNPVLKTPTLDRLHDESIRLVDFHVAPMCTPTRGELMSGRDCLANGAMNVSSGRTLLRRGLPTMADAFARGGYRCGHFGKWHLGDNSPYRPQDRGFHEAVFYPSSHIGSAPDYWNNDYFDDTYWHNGRRERYQGYTTDVFFTEAKRWIGKQAAAGSPFFCYLATAAAHGPLFVPERYRKLYENASLPNFGPKQRENIARFFGMIANIDENMDRLDVFLRELGIRDNTIMVFMTDNGGTVGVPVFNAGMRGQKIDLYDGGHRVPCFIRWPDGKLRAAGDVAGLTEVQDILPTLLDLCGINAPAGAALDGVSLAPLLRGQTDRVPDRTLVVQFSRMDAPSPRQGDAAVLWQRWRLIRDKELYDLATDPGQKSNVIEKFPETAAKLRADYGRWWQHIAANVNKFSAITVGGDAEKLVQLSPADWCDSFLDQGQQIRAGLRRNGFWRIEVAREGNYEIELRRWPREADAPLSAGVPPQKLADGKLPAGVALPIAEARVTIGGIDQRRVVAPDAKQVTFTLRLPAGHTQLQTWFSDAQKRELCGAYYVYITRKDQ